MEIFKLPLMTIIYSMQHPIEHPKLAGPIVRVGSYMNNSFRAYIPPISFGKQYVNGGNPVRRLHSVRSTAPTSAARK